MITETQQKNLKRRLLFLNRQTPPELKGLAFLKELEALREEIENLKQSIPTFELERISRRVTQEVLNRLPKPEKPKDGQTPIAGLHYPDASQIEAMIKTGIKKHIKNALEKLPKPKELDAKTVKKLLEASKGLDRLDASAIKNLPETGPVTVIQRSLFGNGGGLGGAHSTNLEVLVNGVNMGQTYRKLHLRGSGIAATRDSDNGTTISFTESGSSRSISSISSNTSAGSAASTDYVYFCTGTITITLPTAVGNTNRYTIKNMGTGVITIATTSAQTIDGSSTAVMTIQYQSLDLVSNNSNWGVI